MHTYADACRRMQTLADADVCRRSRSWSMRYHLVHYSLVAYQLQLSSGLGASMLQLTSIAYGCIAYVRIAYGCIRHTSVQWPRR